MSSRLLRGFTLIELMITVAIAVILIAVAAPSFQQAINGNRLNTSANEVIAALQLARAEAIRNNRRVVFCRSTDGSACSADDTVWPGWITFVDTNSDGVRDATEPVIKAGTIDAPVQLHSSAALTGLAEAVTFRGDGTARAANGQLLQVSLAACLPTTRPAENVRQVSLDFGSRTAVRRINAAGTCNTPTDQ